LGEDPAENLEIDNVSGVVVLYRKAYVITGLFILTTAVIEDILCE